MNRRIVTTTLALSLTACFASAANAAVAPHAATPTTVMVNTSAKVKLVSFHVRNDSSSAMTLQMGEQKITVEAGKTASIKVPAGIQIVAVNGGGHFTAGAVLTTVSQALSGNTLAIN